MRADELAELVDRAIQKATAPLFARILVLEGKATALDTRLAGVEVQKAIPGPPGPAGRDGANGSNGNDGQPGRDGVNGKDGTLPYRGTFEHGATYERGDLVTWNGSLWHANEHGIGTVPGTSGNGWTLMVKHGRDGRDLREKVS